MLGCKKVIAVIPARGGSKRLPGKNIRQLGDKPLIAWSIEAAKTSKYIDRVIISTDCEDIANIAQLYGGDVPFLRPQELSGDTASSNGVILHALEHIDESFDYVVLLQPTSPLRKAEDIDILLESFDEKTEGVVSVCPCEHSPLWANTLPDDMTMGNFFPESVIGKRSQDLPDYYRLNGSIYAFKVDSFVENNGIFYSDKVKAYNMPVERSVDIDTIVDFHIAEVLLEHMDNLN
ncbi:TPA: cytidylyltransferase domain-containing protein [Vibrio diabolicus]|uniref:acylneuraminate cytidylyltransferase family protein n=1 Tax=Vibrio TaxID=662 RepID=UPI001594AEB3|nr:MULTISPECIES: acylneuraminate cytidylyltransferase family protein [Vibrio]MCQ9246378.1 acylneuraminate cytidylyltransferase family protein [Vibrio diabolicus]MCR9552882.1 acylneuraminate cytidylyltransferase family protein [Vibrio sp. RM-41-2A]MCR9555644.1 acylneuraminate cytidylyltransferase family protein [Vibrio sp. RM-41-2B]MCR9620833.1 acylneuraminate cytidylyltransferase family protein [Vibrio sp. RM-44-3]NVC48658.1 acylneuraminate cytidylyltransferase family protein [Vibrio diabolicu